MNEKALIVLYSSIKKFIRARAYSKLWNLTKKVHAADIAAIMDKLFPSERIELFHVIYNNDIEKAADVISELDPDIAAEIIIKSDFPPEKIVELFRHISSDDVVSILDELPEEIAEKIKELMSPKRTEEVEALLSYKEETAGHIMSTDFYALSEDTTVADAITAIQLAREKESGFYLYVVDKEGKLVGVVSLKQLILNPPSTRLKDIMNRDVISVTVDTDQEEVARQVSAYNLVAIPVVDHDGKLKGVITVDDIIDVIEEEAAEDLLKMAGLEEIDRITTPPIKSIRKRLPWLYVNLITAAVVSSVISLFKGTIQKYALVAAFMPITGLVGNAGVQAIAVMVRELALGEVSWETTRKALLKEILVALGNAVALGIIIAILGQVVTGKPIIGLILFLVLLGDMVIAAIAGTLIPILWKVAGLDPAFGPGTFLTMLTDGFGYFLLFGLTSILIGKLM
ncbi:MAG: magnesium transporter [Candidatus Aminicenantes bacterium]|nr:magnesium transporter [Candidatus Aminicenantes bacterium]